MRTSREEPQSDDRRHHPPAAVTRPDDELAVEIVDVSRRYGAVSALDRVSLTVRRGEFFSLLGPSGCGKTTLLRIIGGFETPSAGDVRIHGRSVVSEPPYLRRTNMIFQHLALFPHMNVFANIAFGLEMKKVPREAIRTKVDRVLALVRLEGLEERGIDQLSGGQKQRVAMARALVNEPEVLLLDEPLGALDLQLRLHMQEELRRLHKALGSTFIFVTHDQGEAITMSDRIGVMSGGRLLQVGTPNEVYENPSHRFVAEFMGHANLLPGIAGMASGERCAVTCGALTFDGRTRSAPPAGSRALLAIRYEKVDVAPAADKVDGLAGTITDLLYMGATRRAEVRIDGCDLVLRSDMPTGERSSRLHLGQAVTVSWAKNSALVLTD